MIIPGKYIGYTYNNAELEYNLFDSELFVDSVNNAVYNSSTDGITASNTTTLKIDTGNMAKYFTPVTPGGRYKLITTGSGSGELSIENGVGTTHLTYEFNCGDTKFIQIPMSCYFIGFVLNQGDFNIRLVRVDDNGNTVLPNGTPIPTTNSEKLKVFESSPVNAPIVNYTLTYNTVPNRLTVSANGGTFNGESELSFNYGLGDVATIPTSRPSRQYISFGGYEFSGISYGSIPTVFENGFTSVCLNYNPAHSTIREVNTVRSSDGIYTNYKLYGQGASSSSYFNINFPFNTVPGDTVTISADYRSRGSLQLICMTKYNDYKGQMHRITKGTSDEWKTFTISRGADNSYTVPTDVFNLDKSKMSALCIMVSSSLDNLSSTKEDPFMDLDIKNIVVTITHSDGTSEIAPTSFKMPRNDVRVNAVWNIVTNTVTYDNLIDFDKVFADAGAKADFNEKSLKVDVDAYTSSQILTLTPGHKYVLSYEAENIGTKNNQSGCFVWYGDTSTFYVNTWNGDNNHYSLSPGESHRVDVPFTVTDASTTVKVRFDSHDGSNNIQNGKLLSDGTRASGYDLKYYNIRLLDLTAMGLDELNLVPKYDGAVFTKTVSTGSEVGAAPISPDLYSQGYEVEGWYTQSGEKVSEDTIWSYNNDIILFSHWTTRKVKVTFDNLFDFDYFTKNYNKNNVEFDRENRTIKVKYEDDNCNFYHKGIPVVPGHKYSVMYTVTNTGEVDEACSGYFVAKSANGTGFNDKDFYISNWLESRVKTGESLDRHFEFVANADYPFVSFRFNCNNLGGSEGHELTYSNIRFIDLTEMGLADKDVIPQYSGSDIQNIKYKTAFGNASQTASLNGYTFDGWYTDNETKIESDYIWNTLDDTVLHSHWTVNTYKITFNANGGSCGEKERTVTYGESVGELPSLNSRVGYVFKGWYDSLDGGQLVTAVTKYSYSENTTLYARWEHDTFVQRSDSIISVRNGLITCADIMSMTATDLASQFENTNIRVTMKADRMATGTTVNLVDDNNEVYATLTVVVFGDINGDGWYDGRDAVLARCILNGVIDRDVIGDAAWAAADCNHDGVISLADVEILENAGVLLSSIDQTKSTEELIETSAEFNEYQLLISQEEIVEQPETEKHDFIYLLMSFIISIITLWFQ